MAEAISRSLSTLRLQLVRWKTRFTAQMVVHTCDRHGRRAAKGGTEALLNEARRRHSSLCRIRPETCQRSYGNILPRVGDKSLASLYDRCTSFRS